LILTPPGPRRPISPPSLHCSSGLAHRSAWPLSSPFFRWLSHSSSGLFRCSACRPSCPSLPVFRCPCTALLGPRIVGLCACRHCPFVALHTAVPCSSIVLFRRSSPQPIAPRFPPGRRAEAGIAGRGIGDEEARPPAASGRGHDGEMPGEGDRAAAGGKRREGPRRAVPNDAKTLTGEAAGGTGGEHQGYANLRRAVAGLYNQPRRKRRAATVTC